MTFWIGVSIAGIYIGVDLFREYRKSKQLRPTELYFDEDSDL